MSFKTQICIVGAGPGGLYAAMRLAQLGLPSLVMEKASFPRQKVCGDILTSNVLRALHALNPSLLQDLLQQPWTMELGATAFGSAQKAGFVMPFNSPANQRLGLPSCVTARRLDFDDFMFQKASLEPLIEIRQNCGVQSVARQSGADFILQTAHGEVQTQYLMLATGANSGLVRDLIPDHNSQPAHSAIGMRMYFQGAEPHLQKSLSEFYLFDKKFMPGGLYITPFADGSVNVNAVMRLDIFQKTRPKLVDLMQGYLQAHPQLRTRFAHASEEGLASGSPLFFGTTKRPLSAGNCLLLGDAGSLTDATNANGIGHAMISGGIAAEHVAVALAAGLAPANYDAAVYARLKNALRPGKVMKALFANSVMAGLSVSMLNASLNRFNSRAVEELVYSSNTATTLLNPKFYWRLFAKG
jgi:menaquinone-9 beta-reductase